MTIGEKIKAFRKQRKLSVAKFALMYGLSQDNLYKWEKGTKPSDPEDYKRLEKILENNPDSLSKISNANMIGEPISTYHSNKKEFIQLSDGKFIMATPLINKKAHAGYLTGWGDEEYIEELPKHSIIVEKPHRGDYISFEVAGDSMDDGTSRSICDKDIVTGRKIERSHWKSKLHINSYNEFIIVTISGILIKELIAHDTVNGTITIRSYNPDKKAYPDKVIQLDKVMQIFNVVQITKHR